MVNVKKQFDYVPKTIRLPASLLADIKHFSQLDRVSENSEIVRALEEYFTQRKLLLNHTGKTDGQKKQAE